jgi:predicted transcriptional regulator YheO
MEKKKMPSQLSEEEYNRLKKKYSAEDDYNKIVKYLGKRKKRKKRNKLGQQIDRYWRQRDVQRLIDKGVINTKIQMKAVKKLLDEIK